MSAQSIPNTISTHLSKGAANRLLDYTKTRLGVPSDAQLAARLGIDRSTLCNMRSGLEVLGSVALVAIHEETGFSTQQLKAIAYRSTPDFDDKNVGDGE